jgi:hypothetical protein
MMYILKRKDDGFYFSGLYPEWVENIERARLFKKAGHLTAFLTMKPWLVKDIEDFEVIGIALSVVKPDTDVLFDWYSKRVTKEI